eukprot:RCo000238
MEVRFVHDPYSVTGYSFMLCLHEPMGNNAPHIAAAPAPVGGASRHPSAPPHHGLLRMLPTPTISPASSVGTLHNLSAPTGSPPMSPPPAENFPANPATAPELSPVIPSVAELLNRHATRQNVSPSSLSQNHSAPQAAAASLGGACGHQKCWKRLRTKKGVDQFLCPKCGARWK